jgi:hypothetical protein
MARCKQGYPFPVTSDRIACTPEPAYSLRPLARIHRSCCLHAEQPPPTYRHFEGSACSRATSSLGNDG